MEEKPNTIFWGGRGRWLLKAKAVGVWTAVFKYFPFSNPSAQIKKMSLVQTTGVRIAAT